MIPAAFVVLDALPLTPNGKVDRRALPDPGRSRSTSAVEDSYQAPATPMESLVAAIWRDVLHVDEVGARDNFFDLGGHSLLSLQVVTRLEKQLGIRLSPRDLIFHTLGQLAALCESRLQEARESQAVRLTQRVVGAFRRVLPK
jgi:acyl carrier protein